MKLLLYKFLINFFFAKCLSDVVFRHFEYKCSFKAPYLAQYDGSIPFWRYGGNAIASSDNLRITPSLKSQKGAVWLKSPVTFQWWEIDFSFRISGRGRVGADGLAFWYVTNPGDFNGPVFGSSDQWNGLAVIFDSFDNDNKHNNPYIMAVLNDGTKSFDHSKDGTGQMISGCLRDFRNKPFSTRAKIEYYKNVLSVLFHNGNNNDENDFELCLRVADVHLPANGFFGLSAATGGLADDHDVKYFLTHSLHAQSPLVVGANKTTIDSEDKQKLAEKYTEYDEKLKTQREQYKKEHPDLIKDADSDWFVTDDQREMHQFLTVQQQIQDSMRTLNSKIDWLMQQEKATAPLAQGGSVMTKYTDDMLNNIQNLLLETKNSIIEMHRKTETILTVQQQQAMARAEVSLTDTSNVLNEVRNDVKSLKKDVILVASKISSVSDDSPCKSISCLSTRTFLAVAAVQIILFVGYFMYRSKKDNYKKFY